MSKSKNSKDRSGEIGMGAGATGAVAGGGTMVALTGGSASAAAITHALATVGGVVGGGMAAGVGVLIGGPVVLGLGAYGISKVIRKSKSKKSK